MSNWTMKDPVTHEGITKTIGEWLDEGIMQLEESFENKRYKYYATLGDRLFQINKAAYLSRTGQTMKKLNESPIVDGITITSKAIRDYNNRRFPESANDSYNEYHGYMTNVQWNLLSGIDRELNFGYCEHELTLDQIRRYSERQREIS